MKGLLERERKMGGEPKGERDKRRGKGKRRGEINMYNFFSYSGKQCLLMFFHWVTWTYKLIVFVNVTVVTM